MLKLHSLSGIHTSDSAVIVLWILKKAPTNFLTLDSSVNKKKIHCIKMHIQYFRKLVYNACNTAMEYMQEKFGIITNEHNSKFCLTSMPKLLFLLYREICTEEEMNDTLLISFT